MDETTCLPDISRRNPQDDYTLLQRVGSGTYGDVFKVGYCVQFTGDYESDSKMLSKQSRIYSAPVHNHNLVSDLGLVG